ncbi:hypothetical protein [Deinococcus marmoris]|uniref:HTH arsR-type domain-containing protein n=1 Tax=Deinococcus marmoris TaxID=249408 RepID=A0A1U7NZI2_9DEIO|nr:hypothetical protein [Deinococcus marmoris]OLV18331.1 hypothetical protein BOO71_0006088 [Deinococcus marmoris]
MTIAQEETRRIGDVPAARALRQNIAFLGLFTQPRSPSEIAASAGMAANLAHHHARKLEGLGLLLEVKREGGKVFYQLAAREFRVPSDLLPPEDAQGNGTADLRELSEGFLRAYGRSWARMHEGEEDVYGFGSGEGPVLLPPPPDSAGLEAHPTHLDSLTLRLSPERYQRLARALSALLAEAHAEGHSASGAHCTLAVLAFRDETKTDGNQLSRSTNSFLGAEF